MTRVVIIGGGPGGYEAALVGSQLGGEVTLIENDGLGGSAVLTDCVPSKTLIATAEVMTDLRGSADLRPPIRYSRSTRYQRRRRCRPGRCQPART
jgi:dihydrolipoamide dehydrogenase